MRNISNYMTPSRCSKWRDYVDILLMVFMLLCNVVAVMVIIYIVKKVL